MLDMPATLHPSHENIEELFVREHGGKVEVEFKGRYPILNWNLNYVLSFINACLDDGGIPQFVTFGGRLNINDKPAVLARCLYGRNNVRLEIKDNKVEFHYDKSGILSNSVMFKNVPEEVVKLLNHWRSDYRILVELFGDEKLKEKLKKAPIVIGGITTVRP